MKKPILVFISILIFMLAGCAMGTTNIPYTASVPAEKLCTLRIVPTLSVKQFDGQPVDWIGGFGSWAEVKIPEGTHTFILNYTSAHGSQTGMTYTASFEAGRTYSMVAQPMTQRTFRVSIVEGVL
jgi:hypothetical protein